MKTLPVLAVVLILSQAQQAPPQNPPAQGTPPPAQGAQPPLGGGGGGRGGGVGRAASPVPYDDYTGFTKLWDGATFKNWDGESDVWTIEDGMLHADTVKTPGQHHIHYIGPGAVMKDFDLKVEFRISATGANGGIQYRSRMLHTVHGGTMAAARRAPVGRAVQADRVPGEAVPVLRRRLLPRRPQRLRHRQIRWRAAARRVDRRPLRRLPRRSPTATSGR